jgi:glutamine amidotransferase
MPENNIVIIDYGAGNLRSVANAISRLGYVPIVTNSARELDRAGIVILPGVGAAREAMNNLKRLGIVEPIKQYISEGRPFFGVCLGLQILLSSTEEDGGCECLGVIPGKVKRLPPGLKTPHMGWNQVSVLKNHPIFKGVPDNTNFYFVHSYYAVPDDKSVVLGETDYGIKICAAIAKGNLVATQFHPEKSGEHGLKVYDNFIKLTLNSL